ncbi:MAG: MBL fold metallo-hydrolase [Ruminococcaceae bacterium]|nr:MBL fold metallo-hydrolase [Oscillospiraceae bacterium]
MELIMLGTSHGIAEPDRFCSATLLRVGERLYVFDCGAPVAGLMRRRGLPYAAIQAVFLTHMHGDHAGGLPGLFDTFTAVMKNGERLPVYFAEEEAIEPFKAWCYAMHSRGKRLERLDAHTVHPGLVFDDGVVTVEAIPTEHIAYENAPSYAFYITAEGKRLLLTGDLTEDAHDFPAVAFTEEFDVIISELTHFTPSSAVSIFSRCRTKQLIFHHVRPNTAEEMLPLCPQFPFSTVIANDGDAFTL